MISRSCIIRGIVALSLATTAAFAQEYPTPTSELQEGPNPGRKALGVLGFGHSQASIDLADAIQSRLVASRKYEVIARKDLSVLLEQKCIDANGEFEPATAQQAGQIAKVDYVVFGSVKSADSTRNRSGYFCSAEAQVRVVDVVTGKIELDVSLKGRASNRQQRFAIRSALDEIAVEFVRRLHWEQNGSVVQIDDNELIIDLGTQHGIVAGSFFEIYRPGEPITRNGEVIGFRETVICKAKAVRVREQWSLVRTGKIKKIGPIAYFDDDLDLLKKVRVNDRARSIRAPKRPKLPF